MDRFTSAHEYVWYMTKQERVFFNMEDILEPSMTGPWGAMPPIGGVKQMEGSGNPTYSGNRPPSNGMRHPRDVWFLNTASYEGAHFAVMPESIARQCIRAGCPPRVCAKCGVPWRREVEVGEPTDHPLRKHRNVAAVQFSADDNEYKPGGNLGKVRERTPGPWHPACKCGTREWKPGLVLDCFAGSGTTLKVAVEEGRRALGFEISEAYCEMARHRVGTAQGPLVEE
jgi:hypothetical protein